VRWFQYGVFCPLFRLHGDREPQMPLTPKRTGGPNEVWSYGEPAYGVLREQLFLRERLRPYVSEQMKAAHETGIPPMRPVFFDFPGDPAAWEAADQFLFGPDLLIAPVVEFGGRSRSVYLPEGAAWSDGWTGEVLDGGATLEVDAPIERIPVFLRDGAELPLRAGGSR
jgi:alpha-D-xyloside xylohydrolase